ncbi:MAG: MopE-related protein [Myxococcota bacterium]|nr:MopE-related protein [Myxococcota bacterium]
MRLLSLTSLALLLACGGTTDGTADGTKDATSDSGSTSDTGTPSDTGTGIEDDKDGDGFSADEDCNDEDASVYPGAEELCDEVDNNCDEVVDEGFDNDADGYWSAAECAFGDDCDDNDATANPAGTEVPYDGIDQDCIDGDLADVDGDGYDAQEAGGEDCNDEDSAINPDATDVPKNDIDEDCSGSDNYDGDMDGYDDEAFGGDDCDDDDASINPDAVDWMNDGVDSNCDGPDGDEVSLDDVSHLIEGTLDTNGIPDYAGYNVALCDLDADGLGDVVVNAPFSNQYQGKTAIFYGSGSSNWTPTLSLTDADTLIEGAVGDCVGWSAACGDFDGDGYDDLSVTTGEIFYYPTQGGYEAELKVLVYHGTGGTLGGSLGEIDADVVVNAALGVPNDAVVFSFETRFQDINGDGAAEILGIYGSEVAERFNGEQRALAIPGGSYSGELDLEDFDLYGFEPPQAHTLTDIQVVDDLTGDGFPEFFFGAPLAATFPPDDINSLEGLVYVISPTSWPTTPSSDNSIRDLANLVIVGDSESSYFGLNSAFADFDGDGSLDWVTSAIGDSTYEEFNGAVAFFSDIGSTLQSASGKQTASSLASGMLYGDDPSGQLGNTLLAVGDMNGNATEDVLVAEPFGGLSGSGFLWLVDGSDLGSNSEVSDVAIYAWTPGTSSEAPSGNSAATGHDIDGDGRNDLVLGSFNWDGGAGRAEIILTSDL